MLALLKQRLDSHFPILTHVQSPIAIFILCLSYPRNAYEISHILFSLCTFLPFHLFSAGFTVLYVSNIPYYTSLIFFLPIQRFCRIFTYRATCVFCSNSHPLSHLTHLFLDTYSIFVSFFGLIISHLSNGLAFLSKLFNSSTIHTIVSAPYLSSKTAQELIASTYSACLISTSESLFASASSPLNSHFFYHQIIKFYYSQFLIVCPFLYKLHRWYRQIIHIYTPLFKSSTPHIFQSGHHFDITERIHCTYLAFKFTNHFQIIHE